jgi:peptide/nickel transport system permease protein
MSTLAISLPRVARHNPLAAVGVVLVAVFAFSAIFAPWIAPQDPAHIDLPNRLQSPSAQHWCGTDELGRDILSRLIWGARISLFVGSSVVVCSLLLGLIIGSLAGYYGGGIDRFVNIVLMNAFLSFPGILIAIAFVAFRGPGIFNLVLALSLGGWVGYARWCAHRCWPCVNANLSKRRARWALEISTSLPDTFCPTLFSR